MSMAVIASQARAVLESYPDIELGVVFGSVATGNTHAASDLDIGILPRFGFSLSLMQELQMQHALSTATGLEVDLVRLDAANPIVKREVARHGTPVLERAPGAFARFAADALLEYLDLQPLLDASRKRYLARILGKPT